MKPPNITPPPADQHQLQATIAQTQQQPQQQQSQPQQPSPAPIEVIATSAPQVQQAPLALTTQPQQQLQIRPQIHSSMTIAPPTTPQPIVLAISPLSGGPPKVGVTTAQALTIAATTQSTPIQLQAPITTHVTTIRPMPNITTSVPPNATTVTNIMPVVSNVTPVPLNAHQQHSTTVAISSQPTLANLPPSNLPVLPITTPTTAAVKTEQTKYICCLLDNGIRCDRVAGNASFSARIQKIVGTKKMNFALDPTVRHAYICEHHKAIITVAKKSTTLARDTKSNARNYTANNSTLASQANSNFNDLRQQQTLQHPVNLELMNNQNRLANNHTGPLNNMGMRQGAQIAYGHYQGGHPNQVGSMDVMMSGNFDSAGGDSLPSSSGGIDVDLQQLQVNTLRRYKRHFRVQTRPGLNKMQLAESLKTHFRTLPIIEKEAITYFVYIVKCYRNKLDNNPKAD